MPIPADKIPALEDLINRLAGESVLAQAGRDDGMIPAYSLLGEMVELSAPEPALHGPIDAMRTMIDKLLDAATPFDAPAIAALRRLVEWLPTVHAALAEGRAVPAMAGATSAPVPSAAPEAAGHDAADTSVDVLMDLNLDENRELLTEFHAEAVDHLQQIEAALLVVDENPDDPEALNSIFRSFHTIKGVSGFLHLTPMHTLTHEVESLLDLARNRKLRLNSTIITEILKSRDVVSAMVQQITDALEKGVLPKTVIPVSHLIRAVKVLAAGGEAAKATPAPVSASAPVAAVASVANTPVPLPVAAPVAAAPEVPENVVPFPGATKPAAAAAPEGAPRAGSSSTVRVNTDKLDSLMDVVGELVIVQSQLLESARTMADQNAHLGRNISQLGRITKELQHTSMALRMIPVKPTFQKMERLARDLSKDFKKKVNFVTSGEDTEVDRTVVEELADPLVHMVRNSLDHGLEPTVDRIDRGKPEAGTVHLKAYHQGSNIVVELSDDGRGIDADRIYKKAIEKGVIAANAVLTRDETLALIFAPGFSTAEKVTSISGRGVGMDVVKRNIEKLRGKIEIDTEVGRGTTFRIKLPLTMAIIDGLVVRVGADRFILPSTSVQMALRPVRDAITTVHGNGEVLDHRGRLLPIHRLHRRFSIPGAVENPTEGILVIVETTGRATALLVDEMVSKQEVVIKNLGGFLHSIAGVAGGAILGDGGIALILDPGSLFDAA